MTTKKRAAFSKGELGTKGLFCASVYDKSWAIRQDVFRYRLSLAIDFRVPFVRYMNSWAEISKRRWRIDPHRKRSFPGTDTLAHGTSHHFNKFFSFCRIHVL